MKKLHLTRSQMLERWRLFSGFLPLQPGLSLPRTDGGLDLDTLFEAQMTAWYSNLLLSAPERLLAPLELADTFLLPPPVRGGITFSLPQGAVRLLGVRLMGWAGDAEIMTDSSSPRALRQLHPFTCATPLDPVAICRPDGTVTIYPASDSENILESLRVAGHPDELFHFDEEALQPLVSAINPEI